MGWWIIILEYACKAESSVADLVLEALLALNLAGDLIKSIEVREALGNDIDGALEVGLHDDEGRSKADASHNINLRSVSQTRQKAYM